jgi:hypothetical protein
MARATPAVLDLPRWFVGLKLRPPMGWIGLWKASQLYVHWQAGETSD